MLKEKSVIVTGGNSGIGKCVAMALASEGARVVIACLDKNKAAQVIEDIKKAGGDAVFAKTDVTVQADCNAVVNLTKELYGGVDILAHCSGISTACNVIDMSDEIWDRTMQINLKGTLNINIACLKAMREQGHGRIVNVASISGKTPEPMNSAYCVSKAGVMMLTQCIALEHAHDGITANAVCPGPTNTEMMQQVIRERSKIENITTEKFEEFFLSDIPLHRMAKPEEVSDLVCFLASDRSAYITGQCITISGGKIWT